jgi:hypothetical protein
MRVLLVGDDPNDHNLHQKGAPFYNALHSDRLPSEALCCGKIPSYFEALTCPWRITELGQNHDAQRYCAPPPRIGQPLMLAWQDLWVRKLSKESCSSSAFPTSSCTEKTKGKEKKPGLPIKGLVKIAK